MLLLQPQRTRRHHATELVECVAIPYGVSTVCRSASPLAVQRTYPIHPNPRAKSTKATRRTMPPMTPDSGKFTRLRTAPTRMSKPAHRGSTPARIVAMPSSTLPTANSRLATRRYTKIAGGPFLEGNSAFRCVPLIFGPTCC